MQSYTHVPLIYDKCRWFTAAWFNLFHFCGAIEQKKAPRRKKNKTKKHKTASDSVRGESQGSFSASGGSVSIWTLLRLCVFTLKSNVIRIKSINYVAYLSVSGEQCAEPVHLWQRLHFCSGGRWRDTKIWHRDIILNLPNHLNAWLRRKSKQSFCVASMSRTQKKKMYRWACKLNKVLAGAAAGGSKGGTVLRCCTTLSLIRQRKSSRFEETRGEIKLGT